MNGNSLRNSSVSSNYEPKYGPGALVQLQPSSRALFEGYRRSIDHSEEELEASNPLHPANPRSSAFLNPDDPISMHLLMETAMSDSQRYEVLPLEEIEDIKKQLVLLATRIEGTKRKLVLESKLRDAAQSLNRLHSTSSRDSVLSASGNRHRRSAMGSRGSTSEFTNKPEEDLVSSTKKCEDLAQELWRLERRAQELQRRLLEHTAGVLQMTHKGYLEEDFPHPTAHITPDNANGREIKHLLHEALDFDDHSFYQTLDTMLDLGYGEEKIDSQDRTGDFARQTQFILDTERRLEDLQQRLRDSITLAGKQSQQLPSPPTRKSQDEGDPTDAVHEQLAYLEKGLEIIQEDKKTALQSAKKSAYATVERLEDLNNQLHGMIARSKEQGSPPYPLPPNVSGESSGAQIGYLEQGLDIVEQTVQRLTDASQSMSSRAATHEEKSGHFETILLGLWSILMADEVGKRKDGQPPDSPRSPSTYEHFSLQAFSAKVQSLYARAKDLQEQKDILGRQIQQQRELNIKSDAEKNAQFTDLTLELAQSKESLERLNREAKESRDKLASMVGRLDELEQDAVLREHRREIDESSTLQAEKDARIVTEERLYAELRVKHDAFEAEKNARIQVEERLYLELEEKQDEIIKLQEELQDFKDDSGIANAESLAKLAQSEKQIKDLSSQIRSLNEDLEHHKACEAMLKESVEHKTKEVETAHLEMESMESDMVRLQTEVTVARAELDGAYGTRAQRAAEVATNPTIQKELDNLAAKNASLLTELAALKAQQENMSEGNADMAQRVQVLQRELSETIGEYEIMTKSSLEFEKEREQLENVIDKLRDRCESLESELSDERVRWLGMKSPSSSGGRDSHPPGTTSTMVLKNEFKKMMRETRAENLKALRFEQEERRKLEALVRSLKRDQAPGKSSLGQISVEELPFEPWKATSQISRNCQKLISLENLSGLLFKLANGRSTTLTSASIAEIFFASIWAIFDMMTSLAEISSSHRRSPLTPLPIAQNERIRPTTPSPPPYGPVKPTIQRTLRHRPSLRAFHPHVDSSESSIPSAHSSIYEASVLTPPLYDAVPENSRSFEFPPIPFTTIPPASDRGTPIYPDSSTLRLPESVQGSQIFAANTVHQPHVLAPISERPSASTLRTSISTYRARSLSLPLPPLPLYSESSTTSSRSNSPPNPATPSPHLPRVSPPHRSPTPPGLPSFGSAAAVNYRLPPPRKRLRDRLRPATRQELEWRAQTVGLPRGVVMRGDDGILIRGRFRHGDGGMGLGMERHPWNRRDLPTTGVAGSNANPLSNNAHVGGHISNTLRRSGPASSNLGLARQIEVARAQQASRRASPHSRGAAPGNYLHEHESGQERGNREKSMGRWDRFWEKACLVCCGTEPEEGGAEMMQVRVVDMANNGGDDGRGTRRDYREGGIARPAL